MEMKEEKLFSQLHTLYWSLCWTIIALSIVLLLLQVYSSSPTLQFLTRYQGLYSSINTQVGINLQSAGILLLLCCIPLGLKLYHKNIKEKEWTEQEDSKLSEVYKWFIIRISLICLPLLFNMVTYFYTQQISALFCCGIAFIAFFFFCRPNETEIIKNISPKED
jgi:Ca2+/Na+ antiporter